MSLPNVYGWITDALEQLESAGLRRHLGLREGKQQAGEIQFDSQSLVNFGSNDYLGLAGHEAIARAACDAVWDQGVGSGASPLITGRGDLHLRLERELAAFERTEATLLFPTGYAANAGTIAALVDARDVIFSDAKNHASIIDGCRLSGAKIQIYEHGSVDSLRQLMREAASRGYRRQLVVTDSLFSMDGDLAPLAALEELARIQGAMLLVDEAHATGVFGAEGRGVCEQTGIEASPVVLRIGTLSKALGCMGGFVAGSQSVIDWLANRARTYFFSTAPPEIISAAAVEALAIVRREPHRRVRLLEQASQLRSQLQDAGFSIGRSQSQIVPVILGDAETTMRVSQELRAAGMLVPGIRPPSVPEGQSLLRISLCFGHTAAQISQLVDTIRNATGGL